MTELHPGLESVQAPIPQEVQATLDRIIAAFQSLLGENLVGLYLHGSLAMGCYNPRSSDIDFLAVVQEPLSVKAKRQVIHFLLGDCRDVRAEMSIVLARDLVNLAYETPFELHYSPYWAERLRREMADPAWEPWRDTRRVDTDLPAHVMMTVHRGRCLCGRPIAEVFHSAPREHFVRSLLEDMIWGRERLDELSVYLVLNLCRFYCYLQTGTVASKTEGAAWAVQNLPAECRPTGEKAWTQYRGSPPAEPLTTQEVEAF